MNSGTRVVLSVIAIAAAIMLVIAPVIANHQASGYVKCHKISPHCKRCCVIRCGHHGCHIIRCHTFCHR